MSVASLGRASFGRVRRWLFAVVAFALGAGCPHLGTSALAAPLPAGESASTRTCARGPIEDVASARKVLSEWAASIGLPPYDKDTSGLGIDRGRFVLTLRFARGWLEVSWTIDAACLPAELAVRASADYAGAPPDHAAARRLADGLNALVVDSRTDEPPSGALTRPSLAVLTAALEALVAALIVLRWPRSSNTAARVPPATLVRVLGLAILVVVLPYRSPTPLEGSVARTLYANWLVLFGMPLAMFLWLAATGYFGYAAAERRDWPAILPLVAGLIVREALTVHSIEEIEVHFYRGYLPDKNSILHPIFQVLTSRFAHDPFAFAMQLNGWMGAVAVLPLFVWARRRTGSRSAALITASFFAFHPIVARFAPTDAPYSLIFLSWFCGLALLSDPGADARALFAGAVFLAIAATCRMEGPLYLLASVFLLNPRHLLRIAARHPFATGLSSIVGAALVGAHWYTCLPFNAFGGRLTLDPTLWPMDSLTGWTIRASLLAPFRHDRGLGFLAALGALAGIVDRRLRIGTGALLGALLVVLPMTQSGDTGILTLHRWVPAYGLLAVAAGVGAYWATRLVPGRLEDHWAAPAIAVLVAFAICAAHRQELTVRYAFNEEFDLLRRRLGPGGLPLSGCLLFSFTPVLDDDLHNVGQVIPGARAVDCRKEDCVGKVQGESCVYYFRPLCCYLHPQATPAECRPHGVSADGSPGPCLLAECARLESALQLSSIEERTVYPHAVWGSPDFLLRYPAEARVGLFRVTGVKASTGP